MSADQQIEQEIQAKGKTAPRVTPAHIEDAVAGEHYFTAMEGVFGAHVNATDKWCKTEALDGSSAPAAPIVTEALGLLTFCVLTLKNGFTVTGESACASPENFDAELGRKIARRNAEAKIWPLLGYELRTKLSEAPKRKVFTARDIKSWHIAPDPVGFRSILRGITHCRRQVEVELDHAEGMTQHVAAQALADKLNAEPA